MRKYVTATLTGAAIALLATSASQGKSANEGCQAPAEAMRALDNLAVAALEGSGATTLNTLKNALSGKVPPPEINGLLDAIREHRRTALALQVAAQDAGYKLQVCARLQN
ncbi:MAG: hypothetical protein AAFO77_00680 [Pseudomonadota bacterium]